MSKVSDRWFVSFEKPRSKAKRRFARESSTFANEREAKAFARQKSGEGFLITAGTINPALPRRIISSNEIDHWLEEEADLDEGSK